MASKVETEAHLAGRERAGDCTGTSQWPGIEQLMIKQVSVSPTEDIIIRKSLYSRIL